MPFVSVDSSRQRGMDAADGAAGFVEMVNGGRAISAAPPLTRSRSTAGVLVSSLRVSYRVACNGLESKSSWRQGGLALLLKSRSTFRSHSTQPAFPLRESEQIIRSLRLRPKGQDRESTCRGPRMRQFTNHQVDTTERGIPNAGLQACRFAFRVSLSC